MEFKLHRVNDELIGVRCSTGGRGGGSMSERSQAASLPVWIGQSPEYVCSAVHPTDIFDGVFLFKFNDVIA